MRFLMPDIIKPVYHFNTTEVIVQQTQQQLQEADEKIIRIMYTHCINNRIINENNDSFTYYKNINNLLVPHSM